MILAEMGFKSVCEERMDYQIYDLRKKNKQMELLWRTPKFDNLEREMENELLLHI